MGRRHGSGLTELKCLIATTVSVCPGPKRIMIPLTPNVSTLGAVMKVRMTATTGTIEYNATQNSDIFARNFITIQCSTEVNPVTANVQNQDPI